MSFAYPGVRMRSPFVALIMVLATVLGTVSGAQAQVPDQPEVSLHYNNLLAIRVNPLGAVDYSQFSFRFRLYENDADIFKANYFGIGVLPALSPAWGRIGAIVELQPLSILRLYAQYTLVGYFGSFDFLASFPSPNVDYSDSAIDAQTATPGLQSYDTYGGELLIGATLQIKIGPVAARSLFRAVYSHYALERGDRVFYDGIVDMVIPNEGWYLTNDVDLFYLIDIDRDLQFAIGGRWTYSHAFFDDGHYLPSEAMGPRVDNDIHRLGPIFALRLDSDPNSRFDNPTLLLLAQWHLQHRWRTGADVHVAAPYVALAFIFRGDLLADD